MKSTINLPISSDIRLLIKEEEKIEAGTLLWEKKEEKFIEAIPVSALLKIPPSQILKYLKKKIGENIEAGTILAKKKSLFSSFLLKSPVEGLIKEVDLKKGTLNILVQKTGNKDKFIFPFSGKIKKITKTHLEIEVEGIIIDLKRGGGKDAVGTLLPLSGENLGVLDIKGEIDGCIIAVQSVALEAVVKMEVLEAKGLILVKRMENPQLPWGEVDEEEFHKLIKERGKKVWLRPEKKEVIVLE